MDKLQLEKIALQKLDLILASIKTEFGIPPIFFLPSLESKIYQKAVFEIKKLQQELKEKALIEIKKPDFLLIISNKILNIIEKRFYCGLIFVFLAGFLSSFIAFNLTGF